MTTITHLAQQLQDELRPLMHDADISPCIQQALLARLTLFLLFNSQDPPLTLSVRVPQPLEGAELTLYFADSRQITLLTRHIQAFTAPNDNLYDAMITLKQRGKQLVQKACFSWEIGRIVRLYCNSSAQNQLC